MAGWWRTNRLPLAALVVLLPVTAGALVWNEWATAFPDVEEPVYVEESGSVQLGGATWGPIRGGELTDVGGLNVPEDGDLIATGVTVTPDGEGVICLSPVLIEQSTGRQWSSVMLEVGAPIDFENPEQCDSERTDAYDLIVPFVVPEDAVGPFWVEVKVGETLSTPVRFPFER